MEHFKIGEAAKQTGMTTRTIRYYEEIGLLGQREDRLPGKLRYYDAEDVARLRKIQHLKELGFTLEEIAQVIDLYFTSGCVIEGKRRIIEILRGHAASAAEKIRELETFRQECEANADRIEQIITECEK